MNRLFMLTFWLLLATISLPGSLCLAQQESRLSVPKKVSGNLACPAPLARRVYARYRHAADSLSWKKASDAAAARLSAAGYAEAALDSFRRSGDHLSLWFHTGPRYLLGSLSTTGLSEHSPFYHEFERLSVRRKPLNWSGVESRLASCLFDYQSRGYPFARFDSLDLSWEPSAAGVLTHIAYRFDPGPLVYIDSVIFRGDFRERQYFLSSLTGVFPGDRYDQRAIDNIPRLLNNSIYFKDAKPPVITFREDSAIVTVNVSRKKSGRFDLLVGILPPKQGETKFQWTGLADFLLVSPVFRAGELLRFRFDKLPGTSQKMLLQYSHPWLFGSPIRAQFDFDLLKQDTTFLTRNLRVAGTYFIKRQLGLRLSARTRSSTLISTAKYETDTVNLPPVLDGKDQIYSLGFEFENLDYRFNPTKGWLISADFGIGRKRITENPRIPDAIYDKVTLLQPRSEAEFKLQFFRSPAKRFVLMLANQTWWLGQKEVFQNDMAQLGGNKLLRGFNENEFFSRFYSVSTLEGRFILEQNSYLFAFTDYGYLENPVNENNPIDHPWGFGAGMTYETKAGMVSVTYAIGRTDGVAFQPSRGRIHVGLINQF